MSSSVQSISGLVSGLDWRETVSQLMAIEGQRVTLVESKVSQAEEKIDAWKKVETYMKSIQTSSKNLNNSDSWDIFSATMTSSNADVKASDLLSLSASSSASPGSYDLVVKSLAQKEKISSQSFQAINEDLGLSGEILVGGQVVDIKSTDTLTNIRDSINAANRGAEASGVTATIVSYGEDDHRLILTNDAAGDTRVDVRDTGSSLLQSLGLASTSTEVVTTTSNGAASDWFSASTVSVETMLGLSAAPSSALVSIGGYSNLSIDLSGSLDDIKTSLNTQAGADIASIESEEIDGSTQYRLRLVGASFTDDNNVLEALGVVRATQGQINQQMQSDVQLETTALATASSATLLTDLNTGSGANNVTVGDTIRISGKQHDGSVVDDTFTIGAGSTLQDLLTVVETAFGGDVTGSVNANGELEFTATTGGESKLEINLFANNEGGGTLDLGSVDVSVYGNDSLLQAGQSAVLEINGSEVERNSNTISDLIGGTTLTLKKADASTTLTLNVERDFDSIEDDVQGMVDKMNELLSYISDQQSYDSEAEQVGGVLFGETALSSIRSGIVGSLISTIPGAASDMRNLVLAGIHLDDEGLITIESDEFRENLETRFEDVRSLFSLTGTSDSTDLELIGANRDVNNDDYAVNVTQAASRGSVTGTADLNDVDGLDGNDVLTITDVSTGRSATVNLTSGMNLDEVIQSINSEMNRAVSEVLTGDTALTASGSPATTSTTWDSVDGGGVVAGDTISIAGTAANGQAVVGEYTIDNPGSDTINGLLSAIEEAFNYDVYASLDASGQIVVTSRDGRDADLSLNLGANNEGGGSLDLGSYSVTQEGRYAMEISALDAGGGQLMIRHDSYGSDNGILLSQSSNHLGMADAQFDGTDVVGTINGEAATGKGQTLSADDDTSSEGLTLRYSGTILGNIGSLNVSVGFAELIERLSFNQVDSFDGLIASRKETLNSSIDTLNDQIERMNRRLDMKEEQMIAQWTRMETTLSALQNQASWLSAQLSSLG